MEVKILYGVNGNFMSLLFLTMITLRTIAVQDGYVESYDDTYDNDQDIEQFLRDEDYENGISFPMREDSKTYTTTLLTSHRKSNKCDEDQILSYLAELEVINPESILRIASNKDLEHLCRFVRTLWRHIRLCIMIYINNESEIVS
ncbi:uncharacterized protein LOC107270671 [Cephus cinctus]|uniref:Uncharacterized protein LOC107270671 n=1 Tax=Cephus cinctus TaxID=211228 RepID=A0AAJ7RNH8_CEPCN|nr:uncharacterized protein LOC107270671 [Cephus cinctus]